MILGTRRTQDLGIPSHRFRAYIRACRRLGPHRLVEPASLTMDQALVEPLFHNLQVTEEGGPHAPTVDVLVAAQLGVTDEGHLHSPPSGLASSTVKRLLEPLISEHWLVPAAGAARCCHRVTAVYGGPDIPGQPTYRAYAFGDDGRMTALPQCPQVSATDLSPWPVIMWEPSRPWRPGHRRAAGVLGRFLLGPPSVSCVGPHTWGIGCRPVQDLVVREAMTRLTVMAAVGKGTLSHSDGLPGSSRAAAVAFGPDYASGSPWMSLHPRHRIHWRDRQAEQEDPPATSTPLSPQTDTLDLAASHTAACGTCPVHAGMVNFTCSGAFSSIPGFQET